MNGERGELEANEQELIEELEEALKDEEKMGGEEIGACGE